MRLIRYIMLTFTFICETISQDPVEQSSKGGVKQRTVPFEPLSLTHTDIF